MHTEHLQNVSVGRVLLGWAVAAAITSFVLLMLAAFNALPFGGDGGWWNVVAAGVGFFGGGFFAGFRAMQAPILHGVAIALMAGLLSGGDVGRAVRGTLDTEFRCTKGDLFFQIDPNRFVGGTTLAANATRYLDELRASKPQAGFDHVAVPGDRGYEIRKERLVNGIPHPEEIWYAAERLRAAISS